MSASRRMRAIPLVSPEHARRVSERLSSCVAHLYGVLDDVKDPEIPVLSIWDLGVLQSVSQVGDEIVVTITPTYSGCPAMDVIAEDIEQALNQAGVTAMRIVTSLSPAWSTDLMAPDARRRLNQYGIAPPGELACPQCGSDQVELISESGSTSCKALYRCQACAEPFDYFKKI